MQIDVTTAVAIIGVALPLTSWLTSTFVSRKNAMRDVAQELSKGDVARLRVDVDTLKSRVDESSNSHSSCLMSRHANNTNLERSLRDEISLAKSTLSEQLTELRRRHDHLVVSFEAYQERATLMMQSMQSAIEVNIIRELRDAE